MSRSTRPTRHPKHHITHMLSLKLDHRMELLQVATPRPRPQQIAKNNNSHCARSMRQATNHTQRRSANSLEITTRSRPTPLQWTLWHSEASPTTHRRKWSPARVVTQTARASTLPSTRPTPLTERESAQSPLAPHQKAPPTQSQPRDQQSRLMTRMPLVPSWATT